MHSFKDKTILYVEDDKESRKHVSFLLNMLFGETLIASDGQEAFELYQSKYCDIVLSDIKMPKMDGLELASRIRQSDPATPIVLLTSFTEKQLLLDAANLSIDGYIVKPIDLDTLIKALVKAFTRIKQSARPVLLCKNTIFNPSTKSILKDDDSIRLSAMEVKLLELFLLNKNIVVTKEQISEALWPLEPVCQSAVKTIVLRLRKK